MIKLAPKNKRTKLNYKIIVQFFGIHNLFVDRNEKQC